MQDTRCQFEGIMTIGRHNSDKTTASAICYGLIWIITLLSRAADSLKRQACISRHVIEAYCQIALLGGNGLPRVQIGARPETAIFTKVTSAFGSNRVSANTQTQVGPNGLETTRG
ncbi:hypothetical protein PspR76_31325 [Pseudomonas sp. R76]|nr:hypothetical protein PspR76_31325 [Pseudomonas sp. R76]